MFDRYSCIDMFGPIYGENWYAAEIVDGLTYRWSGPGAISSLRVPTLGARHIRLRWILAHHPKEHQLNEVRCTVDGQDIELRWSMRSAFSSFWGDIDLKNKTPSVLATIAAPFWTLPQNIAREGGRNQGLAVNRVEIFALEEEALGAQAQSLQQTYFELESRLREAQGELAARDPQMTEVMSSTSWRATTPLRWLKKDKDQ